MSANQMAPHFWIYLFICVPSQVAATPAGSNYSGVEEICPLQK